MIKKNKGLIALLAIIIVLVSAYAAISLINTDNSDSPSEIKESVEIYNIDTQNIMNIRFVSDDETYSLVYGDEISIPELPGSYIDEEKAKTTRQQVSMILTDEIIDKGEESLEEFGLSTPSLTVEISDSKNILKVLYIGDESPVGNGYYCKVKGEDSVFILSSYKYSYINRASSYYRTMSFFEVDRNTISDITLDVYGKHLLSFKENIVEDEDTPHNTFDKYQMITPFNWPASSNMVAKILDSVTALEVVEYTSESSKDMAKYGFSPYVAKLNFIHDGGKSDTIYFGNNKEGVIYIRTDKDDKIYGLSYEQFGYLELEPFAYLSTFAFLRNIMTVKNINYTHNTLTANFVIKPVDTENVDVKKDGKLMSQDDFKSLYSELISISIAGAYDGVMPGKAFLSYTFDYNDMTSEKVEFFKIDERRAALSVNGKCQFYVNMLELNEKLKKIDEKISSN